MTLGELYEWGRRILRETGIEEAGTDARLLLESCCQVTYSTLLAHPDREIEKEQEEAYWIFV